MNPLDELLSATGQAQGPTFEELRNARAALDAATAEMSAQRNATEAQPGPPTGR